MYKKSGEHELVIKHNQLVDELRELIKSIEALERVHRNNIPRAKYDWEVKACERCVNFPNDDTKEKGIWIYGGIKQESQEKVKEHMRLFGSIVNGPSETCSSVFYYRRNGLLLHDGGGALVFPRFSQCTDEQWEKLMGGEMVTELLQDYYRDNS